MNAASTNGRLDVYDAMSMQGGHAVALVGYDQNQFIVRNSWGTPWGDKDFAYASNAYAAAAFTEAYGVSVI
jgi:C1A family cysteine protease